MKAKGKKPLLLVEALGVRNDSGLGKLVRMFVQSLGGISDFADVQVILPEHDSFIPNAHCLPVRVHPRPMRLWNEISFPYLIQKLKPQAVLCLGWTLPLWRPKAKYGLLIADIGPAENLGFAMSSRDSANRSWLKRMPKRADLILTNAMFTKGRMQAVLGLDPEKIKVVKPIDSQWFAKPEETEAGEYPQGPYFLAMGNIEPRKNFPGLIAAYAQLKIRRPEIPPLYILGHKAWGYQETEDMVLKLGLKGSVVLQGYLPERDRNAYLAHCSLFISSSLYEGWGLPLFEALALERPAIYHANSSQGEFAKGLALGIDCSDTTALSEAMEVLWSSLEARESVLARLRMGFPQILKYDLELELKSVLLTLLG